MSCTIFMQPSKSASIDNVIALFAMGCISWATETRSFGSSTIDGMPAAAQYAETAADVSPVDAHATARIFDRIWLTIETSTVIPRSLNEPVCDVPHCLMKISST